MRRRCSIVPMLLVALAVGVVAACGGDSKDDGAPPTAIASEPTAAPTATPAYPEVARAKVTTPDLNVRTGPGRSYAVIGRLQPSDELPVSGRFEGADWIALPGIGWVVYEKDWLQLSKPYESLPLVREADATFEFVGPLHPPNARAGIPVVDELVEAIVAGDRTALLQLVRAPRATATPTGSGPPPTATAAPAAPAATSAPGSCAEVVHPASRLQEFVERIFRSEVPRASAGGRAALRLYAVVRAPAVGSAPSDYVAIFAFEGGEGRQFWVAPDGRLTQFSLGCGPTVPGNMLRLDRGEPFFWVRPLPPPPTRPIQ